MQRPPGGIGRYAAELARLLPDVGVADGPAGRGEFEVVGFVARHPRRGIDAAMRSLALPERVTSLPWPRPLLYELWNRWGLADPARHRGAGGLRSVDVVHAPSVAVPPRGRVPLVVTVHDAAPVLFPETFPARGRRFHELGFRAAARRADVVIAPTEAAADEIATHTEIPRARITVIHHGVEVVVASTAAVDAARAELGLGSEPYVLWVGTLEPRKGVDVLIDAFARVAAGGGSAHRLVLVGPRGWRQGLAHAKEHAAGLGHRVVFTGPVEPARLRALYRGADLFAFPSRHEGFGLPVLEAGAQGAAVLASDLPVLREVAGDAAAFVAEGDVAAWAEALEALLGDPARRAALGAAGRARASQFTWLASASRHAEVYRSLV